MAKTKPTVVAVTKGRSQDEILQLMTNFDVMNIGENRWQEFEEKFLGEYENLYKLCQLKEISFHFIGHLQSNKVAKVIKYFDLIQSVDSEKLLQKIKVEAEKQGVTQRILLQVNISKDPDKFGFAPDEIQRLLEDHANSESLSIDGLMAILKKDLTPEEQFEYYSELARLSKKFKFSRSNPILSMGMSQDYPTAIKAGSNMIRVGRALEKVLSEGVEY